MPIETITVDGNGNTISGWAAEGGTFTNMQTDDGVTTKLYTPTNNDLRQFSLTNPASLAGATINSIRVIAKVATLGAYNADFQINIRTNSTDYNSSTITHNGTTYTQYSNVWSTNPNTGVAWTIADLNALQIGVTKIGADGLRITYMIAEIDYTVSGISNKQYLGFF